jgi:hypothetical protein
LKNSARTAVFVIAAMAVIAPAASYADGPFGSVHVNVNRHEYKGHCPVEVLFTGTINFEHPHPRGFAMNYHWERSDGAKGPVQVVHPNPEQRNLVVREPWHIGGGHHDLSATLFVNSGNTHIRETSQNVHVECR